MRIGAQWIYSQAKAGRSSTTTRRGSGSATSSPTPERSSCSIALIVGGIGVRRLRNGGGQGLLKASMVIAWIVLAAALVAVWAMAGKPD